MLGWNNGTEQEIFSLDEMIDQFSIERVHAHGAKFDFEKAKWYNHEWIKKLTAQRLMPDVKQIFEQKGITINDEATFEKVIELIKERCPLITDFWEQGSFFFSAPLQIDTGSIISKWTEIKNQFFIELIRSYSLLNSWDAAELELVFKEIAAAVRLKPGELMLPFRIMLVGGKFGPGVFDIASLIGKEETIKRIQHTLSLLK